MTRMTLAPLALCLALATGSAAAGQEAAHGHHDHAHETDSDSAHLAEGAGLRALHAWTRATDAASALVFVEIENVSDHTVALKGAASEVAESGALVGFALVDGAPAHQPVGETEIAPGGEIDFEPFGLAIALDGLARPLAQGETFAVTLLTDHGTLEMTVEVEAADATQHSHAGHMH